MFKAVSLCSILLLCSGCSLFSKKVAQVHEQQQQVSDTVKDGRALASDASKSGQDLRQVNDVGKVDSSKVSYRKDDLTLLIQADPGLNKYRNNAHALFVCIYQLKDPNAFNQLAEEKENMGKLLECGRFDSSVANAKRMVVQPGQTLRETRDRAEGTRYIGIATGYYGTGKEKTSHLAPLLIRNGDLSRNTVQIDLGPFEIDNVTVK